MSHVPGKPYRMGNIDPAENSETELLRAYTIVQKKLWTSVVNTKTL